MAGGLIFMAIMGCGDAGGSCQEVARAPVAYASMAECQAAQDAVLARTDLDFPEVAAQCVASQPAAKPVRRNPALRMASARG